MVLKIMEYSEELIEECKRCFKEENNIDLADEMASEFLDSFSGLYLAFAKIRTSINTELLAIQKVK